MRRLFVIFAIVSIITGAGAVFAGNQDEANNIAHQLGLKYPQQNVEVAYQDGKVRLRGEVSSEAQRAEIKEFVQAMPLVKNVQESFVVTGSSATPLALPQLGSAPASILAKAEPAKISPMYSAQVSQAEVTPAIPTETFVPKVVAPATVSPAFKVPAPSTSQPVSPYAAPQISEQVYSEGQIVYQGGAPMQYQQMQPQGQPMVPGQNGQPNLPNHAWPTYADYPNYGQVSYPKQYGAGAFPYVGPFYPYPQVPLGWRKVTMEWHDGYWWLDFNDGSPQGPFSPLFRQPTKYR